MPIIQWTRLLATTGGYQPGRGVSVGGEGFLYITGYTTGSLDGQNNSGLNDAFISKFSPTGTKVWTKLFGSASDDFATSVSVAVDGSVYVAGYTFGSFGGQSNGGTSDAFLTKYDSNGNVTWTKFLGNSNFEDTLAVQTGRDGAVYVTGYTSGTLDGQVYAGGNHDAYLTKYLADGTKAWTRLLGTSQTDQATALSVGSDGTVFVGGLTYSALDGQVYNGGQDAFLVKFSADGTKIWTREIGSSGADRINATAIGPDGSIYACGYTTGALDGQANPGNYTSFLVKYGADGSKLWTKLLGNNLYNAKAISIGPNGTISLSGMTNGWIDGQSDTSANDAFLIQYTSDGTKLSTITFGTSLNDVANSIATAPDGSIYVGGYTQSALNGQSYIGGTGDGAAYLVKFQPDAISTYALTAGASAVNEGATATFTLTTTNVAAGTSVPYTLSGAGITAADISNLVPGQPVIDLGAYGKLILPVQVDGGKWFYYWDASGDGTGSDGQADFKTPAYLYSLFTQDANGISQASGRTSEIYRYATLNGVKVALPTLGAVPPYTVHLGTSVGSTIASQGSNAVNPTYDDYLAIWDAYNGIGTSDNLEGTPTGWSNGQGNGYVAAPPTGVISASMRLTNNFGDGGGTFSNPSDPNWSGAVALQVFFDASVPVTLFNGVFTGTAIVDSAGKAKISIPIAADQTTEGPETLTITAQGISASVAINDTSLTPAIFVVDRSFVVTQSNQTIYGGAGTAVIWINKGAYSKVYAYNSTTSQTDIQPNGQLVDFIGDTFIYGNTQASNTRLNLSFISNQSQVTVDARNFHTTGIVTTSVGANFFTDHVAEFEYESGSADTILSSGSYESYSGYRDGSNSGINTNGAGLTVVFPKSFASYAISYNQTSRNDPSGSIFVQDQSIPIYGNGFADSRVELRGAKALVFTDRTITIESNGQPSTTAPSYVIASVNASVGEGGIASFKLTTANVAAGSTVDYLLSGTGITASDIVGGQLNGSVVLDSSGAVTISIPIASDGVAEGSETLVVTVAGRSASVLITDASTVLVPTYALSAANFSVNEGASVIFTLTTNNVAGGTALTYTLSGTGITANDIFGGALTGTAVIDSTGRAIISVPISSDLNTEGAETLTITVQSATASVLINDTSVATVTPTYFLTTASASVNEGSVATFTLTTTNVPGGTSIPYTLAGAGITSGDISGGQLSGSVVVDANGRATISIPIASDGIAEGSETLLVTAGGKTASILINDAGIAKTGTTGPDSLVGSVGSDTLDGGGGVDTVFYGSNRSAYTLTRGVSNWTASSLADGVDSLVNVERLHFVDQSLALDVGVNQPSGQAAVLLGAVLPGKLALDPSKQALMGTVIGLFDMGYSLTDLAGALLRLDIWTILTGSNSNQARASYLLSNVNGVAPDAATLANGVNALNSEPVQGTWLAALAGGSSGQNHIGLSTLAQTGLAYIAPESVFSSSINVDEGGSFNFIVNSNLPAGASVTYTLSGAGITPGDIVGGALSGTAPVNFYGQATVVGGVVADKLTEGPETLVFTSRGLTASVVINDTSVPAIPTYAITADSASVNEGGNVTFTVNTTNVASGTAIPYTLSGTGINGADIVGGQLSGSAVVNSAGSAAITVAIAADLFTEGPEILAVTMSGKTATVVINDTSLSKATYQLILSSIAVNGGDTLTVSLKTTNVAVGAYVPYTLTGVSPVDISNGSLSGAFVVDSTGLASINIANALHQNVLVMSINVYDQQQTVTLLGVKGG
jgi:hypothetical protein